MNLPIDDRKKIKQSLQNPDGLINIDNLTLYIFLMEEKLKNLEDRIKMLEECK